MSELSDYIRIVSGPYELQLRSRITELETAIKAEREKVERLVDALRLAETSMSRLNGEVTLEVWKSLYDPIHAARAAIKELEL